MSSFCICKSYSHFFSKNNCELDIVLTRTVNILTTNGGWSGGAKVSCILSHQGVQLILAYSWARPAILVAGKDRRGMFLFLLLLHFHSCSYLFPVSLFHLFCYLFYLFSLSVGDDTKWPTRVDVPLNPNTINLTTNELVKLTMLWTTGPRFIKAAVRLVCMCSKLFTNELWVVPYHSPSVVCSFDAY